MKKLLYVGSSWAVRSFDNPYENPPKPGEILGQDYTNLAHELGVDVIDLSQYSISNLSCFNLVWEYGNNYDGIIWVYCEPIKDLNYKNYSSIEEFLTKDNFWEIRSCINNIILERIAELNSPVALIGGASDVEGAEYDNLTVIHPSWQKFLAKQAGVKLNHGWSPDVAHHEMMLHPKLKPSHGLVELISDTFTAWDQIASKKLFARTHPNTAGTKLFASHIKSSLNSWLDTI